MRFPRLKAGRQTIPAGLDPIEGASSPPDIATIDEDRKALHYINVPTRALQSIVAVKAICERTMSMHISGNPLHVLGLLNVVKGLRPKAFNQQSNWPATCTRIAHLAIRFVAFTSRFGGLMRLGASLCIVALFLLSAQVVRADGISSSDPQILVGRGLDPAPPTPVGLQFDVELDASGGGIFNFTNDSGQDWVAFTLSATFATDMAMSFAEVCEVGSDIFLDISCAATGKTLNITFANGSIPAGSNFFLDFNQNSSFGSPGSENGAGIWGSGTDFEATAITTPEPGTLILFLSSLGGFWLRRKEMRA